MNRDGSFEDLRNTANCFVELEEENNKLKEQLEYLRSNEYLNQVKWERNFNEDLVKELQQRINKAIEYIVTNREPVDERDGEILFWLSDEFDEEDLLKILKGEENE